MEYLQQLKDKPDGVYDNIIPGVTFTKLGNLVQGNYTRDVMYTAGWTELNCMWRGHIYDLVLNRLVARPFEKFFNIEEHPSTKLNTLMDLRSTTTCYYKEKLDGTMIIVYRHPTDGILKVATRGALVPLVGTNYPNYHAKAEEILKTKYPKFYAEAEIGKTYVFELIWNEGRAGLVTKYDRDDMYLIGMLENDFSIDYPHDKVELTRKTYDLSEHDSKPTGLTTVQDILMWAEKYEDEHVTEGVVLNFETSNTVVKRAKVKTTQYLTIHKMMMEVTPSELFEKIISGNHFLFLKNLPKELPIKAVVVYRKYYYIINRVLELYEPISHIQSQKEFALKVQADVPKEFQKFMYSLRSGFGINMVMKADDLKR